MADTRADRRAFLKAGAIAAAPLAAAAPAALLANGDAALKLARLEDERAIEALHRSYMRGDARALAEGLRSISQDPHDDLMVVLSDDGRSAQLSSSVCVEIQTDFTGHTTIEKMARFEGLGSHRRSEVRTLTTEFVKGQDGWRIAGARLA